MKILRRLRLPIRARLMGLFALLLVAFAVVLGLLYNTLLLRQMIVHYSRTMHHDAYAISQNLSELIAPSNYQALDETRFIVGEDNLAPYLAMTESLTNCNVYLVDAAHNVTGYFDGVVQTLDNPLLPAWLEQAVALGFMGKTPSVQAKEEGDVHLASCMPIMNSHSQVLGVVLLEAGLRELGYAQLPSGTILGISGLIAFVLAGVLALFFSRLFTRPISAVERVAVALADGRYETRTQIVQMDEIGSLARSMDELAGRLEEAKAQEDAHRRQQQRLFSNISHELRTPVTVIRGSLEALRDGVVTQPQEVEAYYVQMIRESRWLQQLIRDILELSRLQSDDFALAQEPVDLCELLGDVAMSARALCETKGVVLVCEEPKGNHTVTGDYARLRQMLLAVADNAVKFTPAGSAVRIWMESEAPVIGIADEGAGMEPEELSRIFDRFHTARDPSREGTGLGLAIVKEIARRHGIKISVESEPGRGSVFLFRF